jgi:hypothetical protein
MLKMACLIFCLNCNFKLNQFSHQDKNITVGFLSPTKKVVASGSKFIENVVPVQESTS